MPVVPGIAAIGVINFGYNAIAFRVHYRNITPSVVTTSSIPSPVLYDTTAGVDVGIPRIIGVAVEVVTAVTARNPTDRSRTLAPEGLYSTDTTNPFLAPGTSGEV